MDSVTDATDADTELTDEEVLRSGSQTGVSDQEEVTQSPAVKRHGSSIPPVLTTMTSQLMTNGVGSGHKSDPVSSILDRIDKELEAMNQRDSQSSSKNKSTSKSNRSLGSGSADSGMGTVSSGIGTVSFSDDHVNSDRSPDRKKDKISGSAEVYSENTTDACTDDDVTRCQDDQPSDLDSLSAQQIDLKFKEIMRKKKDEPVTSDPELRSRRRRNSTGKLTDDRACGGKMERPKSASGRREKLIVPPDLPRHPGKPLGAISSRLRSRSANRASANMLSTGCEEKLGEDKDGVSRPTGYATDNESVKTEDFENKFMNLLVPAPDSESTQIDNSESRKSRSSRKSETNTSQPQSQDETDCKTVEPVQTETEENKSNDDSDIIQRLRNISRSPALASPITDAQTQPVSSTSPLATPRSATPTLIAPLSNTTPTPILSRSRSASPSKTKGERKSVSMADSRATRREIAAESAIIQQEMELERRARSVSPTASSLSVSPPPPYSTHTTSPPSSRHRPRPSAITKATDKLKNDLSTDIAKVFANTSAVFSSAEDALLAGHELKTVRQALHLTRKELREAEAELKHARELTEDAKSGLMVIEFKRGNATKELERLADDQKRKQTQMTSLDSEFKAKLEELKTMTSLGLTREDCIEIKSMKDENVCMKSRLRSMEGLQLERDELLRQLDAAKDDVMRDQRAARIHAAELQEEIETLSARLEETQTGWGDGQVTIARLEAAFRKMEREKNEVIQAQSLEYDSLKCQHREEVNENQERLRKEMESLDFELRELKERVKSLQGDNSSKETLVGQLRSQISELQSVLSKERQERHKTSSDQKNALRQLKKETAAAVLKLKESMFLEKQKCLEDVRYEMEQERRESGARNEDKLSTIVEQNAKELANKNGEISRLQDKISRLEHESQLLMESKIHEAVNRERERGDMEKEREIRTEKEDGKRRVDELTNQVERERNSGKELQREVERGIQSGKELQKEVERERQTSKDLQSELTNLRKELEEQRRQQREQTKERLMAVAKAKEQVKEQGSAEIERVKFNMSQEHQRELDHLNEKLRYQEEKLTAYQNDKEDLIVRESRALQVLEHTERTVIGELNEECSKVAGLLGISPRTVHQTSFHLETRDGRSSPSPSSRPAIITAVANLRACNEELHNHIAEIQQEVESLRVMVETVTKEKEEAIENCKLQMEKQRTLDLEKLKDKLLKDHVEEMSQVIRQCAESTQKLTANNSQLSSTNDQLAIDNKNLKHYGDVALLEALQAKDAELKSLQRSVDQWQKEVADKFQTQLQLQMAKEREKYQALQHHSTREQKRISDLQKGEIDRLEKEVTKLAMSQSPVQDKNSQKATSNNVPVTASSATSQMPDTSKIKASEQLQMRIKQLQAENAALRKQRLLASQSLNSSLPNLAKPKSSRPSSPFARSRSPTRDMIQSMSERFRKGEKQAIEAEERAKLSQKAMNNKMEEMAKLQHTLFSQNQELQELEKAYSDLHNKYNKRSASPSRCLSPTRSMSPTRCISPARCRSPTRCLSPSRLSNTAY